ncbi:transcriptional regulator [Helicobacter sp.]|uniref:transcriptional regulator n=1 Tax=Helicobacter sp. TaxID=218 RepID=UPI0025BCAB24|nr:transcriptional regulator [Helicobacter sp.]MBR2493980.1 transcriptional regulator [Helicobacter sp.]
MAGILGIDTKTLYNWKKHKPNLYRIVMLGFKFDELLECSKRNYVELLEIEARFT